MVKSEIIKHIEKVFLVQFDEEFTESTDLFKAGVIDSHGYIQLMQFIQSAYRIKFSKEEMLSGVISSVEGIVNLVESKLERELENNS